MFRKEFIKVKKQGKDKITWRSHEPLRVEALSDAVFGFAVSLLIISLEVPKTSGELLESLKGFFPFVCCFALIFYIWFEQYVFFRRYGMHDLGTIVLNAALMLVILFYVYPLKFLFNSALLHRGTIEDNDLTPLLLVYHGGFTCIYLLYTLMYCNAFKRREELQLNAIEIFETRTSIFMFLGITCVGILLLIVALFTGRNGFVSMGLYSLIGPVMMIVSGRRDKLFRKKFGNAPMEEPHLGTD